MITLLGNGTLEVFKAPPKQQVGSGAEQGLGAWLGRFASADGASRALAAAGKAQLGKAQLGKALLGRGRAEGTGALPPSRFEGVAPGWSRSGRLCFEATLYMGKRAPKKKVGTYESEHEALEAWNRAALADGRHAQVWVELASSTPCPQRAEQAAANILNGVAELVHDFERDHVGGGAMDEGDDGGGGSQQLVPAPVSALPRPAAASASPRLPLVPAPASVFPWPAAAPKATTSEFPRPAAAASLAIKGSAVQPLVISALPLGEQGATWRQARFWPLLALARAQMGSSAAGGGGEEAVAAAAAALAGGLADALGVQPLPPVVGGISGPCLGQMLGSLRAEVGQCADEDALRLLAARAVALAAAALFDESR
ncbi:hypothetical protein T492DRAFT_848120 [Pavlovales sp. CCMP2436]|nr:hypothetical protein T492DRAFT_848120 [Pavlovales sp. CCMP2436]